MTLDGRVHAFRLRLLARAQQLDNVAKACREAGVSRTLFYRWRARSLPTGRTGCIPAGKVHDEGGRRG